jgi:O-antigen/teichoic acid export membrane protein
VTESDTAVPRSRSLRRDALVLAAGMAVANAGNYAFNVVMAFLLGPEAYGALAALLALVLVGSVPGLALQAVVARRTTLAGGPAWPGVGWLVGRAGAGLVVLTVLLGPGLVLFLHLDSAVPVAWLALALAPTPLLFAVQGLLQGRERFGGLAAVMVAGAAVKLAAGLALVAAGLGVSGAMAGVAAGAVLAALAGLRLATTAPGDADSPAPVDPDPAVPRPATPGGVDSPAPSTPGSATLPLRGTRPRRVGVTRALHGWRAGPRRVGVTRARTQPGGPPSPTPPSKAPSTTPPSKAPSATLASGAPSTTQPGGTFPATPPSEAPSATRPGTGRPGAGWWREVGSATTGLLGLFLLANVDVLLARHYLDRAAAGRYALGAVVAKIAFWAPQFVVTVIFPRLVGVADPRRLLGGSAWLIAGFGGLLAGGLVLADGLGLVVPVLGGGYAGLGPLLPLFAALGTALALVQLLLFEGIATRDRRMGRAVAAALVAEVALVAGRLHGSVAQVAGTALAVAVALAAAGWWLLRRRLARPPAPTPAVP